MLRRILRRAFGVVLHAARGRVEVLGGDLEVVVGGDLGGVPAPRGGDVGGEGLSQLGRPGGAEVVPELGPGLEARPLDDALQPGPEVGTGFARVGDDVLRPVFGLFEGVAQVRQQLRKQRDDAGPLAVVVFGLGRGHGKTVVGPVDVRPAETERLAGSAEPTEPGQREQNAPLRIGAGVDHGGGFFTGDEVVAGAFWPDVSGQTIEGVRVDEAAFQGISEQLAGTPSRAANGVVSQSIGEQGAPPIVGVGCGNAAEVTVLAELGGEVAASLLEVGHGPGLERGLASFNVAVDERAESGGGAGLDEAYVGELGVQGVAEPGDPAGGLGLDGLAGELRRQQRLDLDADGLGVLFGQLAQADGRALAVGVGELDAAVAVGFGGDGGQGGVPFVDRHFS